MATTLSPIAHQIWDMKYRYRQADGSLVDRTIEDSWRRVAAALAEAEAGEEARASWADRFYDAMAGFRFLPAGRILAGAGTARSVTLFNCFVMGTIADDMSGIFDRLKESALTLQQGGGIGQDFSTLRPKGAPVKGVGADASGPISFMKVWDAMCRTIMSAGHRRGAMMATLRADHPDIEAFVDAKHEPGQLSMFNLSVLATDDFMAAVKADTAWELTFGGTVYKTVSARALWDKIMRANYAYAEPGVIFIDRVNRLNNLRYVERIDATNPCGEQPLPPYGACLLGSINLAALVDDPFTEQARLDLDALARLTAIAVRMLDNAIDISAYPLPEQAEEARRKRRIGLGVTGLADALAMCRVRYGSPGAVALAAEWMGALKDAAYRASITLADEKGAFPAFDAEALLATDAMAGLAPELRQGIADKGLRNGLLTSIAPTGTISLLADNVSSGIEPIFSYSHQRNLLMPDGSARSEAISDAAYRRFRKHAGDDAPLPDYFVEAQALEPSDHVAMQAAIQPTIDSAISKTINCPEEIGFDAFKAVYMMAYDQGCKGCTTYRPNDVTGAVLEAGARAGGESAGDIADPAGQGELALPGAVAARSGSDAAGVVYMTQPLDRPEELPGATYKLRWPESEHALYVTINDIVQDGRRRPFEIFIHSKNMEHYAWTLGLTRMISAVFRRGGDVSFVVDELKAVFDPRGGQWVAGRYVPSLLAAIGDVIERHMIAIGFVTRGEGLGENHHLAVDPASPRRKGCPRCGRPDLIHQEGCQSCTACGYSRCA